MTSITRQNVPYTKCFCEENTYRLLKYLGTGYALFISNDSKSVKFHTVNITWDYHVVALVNKQIYDHDAVNLSFPCSLNTWLKESFNDNDPDNLKPMFRLVSWDILQKHFNSDRSHMFQHKDFMEKHGYHFPKEPVIGNGTNLFSDFVTMDKDKGYGTVLTKDELIKTMNI